MQKSNKQRTAALLAVLCTFLWGSAYPCVKLGYALFGIADGTPFDRIFFAGLRFTAAGLLTLAAAYGLRRRGCRLRRSHVLPALGLGLVLTTLQYICFYLGLANSLGSRGAILNGTSTFFTVVLAAAFFRGEKINARKLTGCLIGFAGIVAVNLGGGLGGRFTWRGDFLMILSSLAFALGSVISKKLAQTEDSIFLSGVQMSFGGALLALLGLAAGGRLYRVSPEGVLLLAYMSCLSAAAFSIWTTLLRSNDTVSVSVYYFLVPVFGVVLSAVFLREQAFTVPNLAALALVSAGIWIVNRIPQKREKRRESN